MKSSAMSKSGFADRASAAGKILSGSSAKGARTVAGAALSAPAPLSFSYEAMLRGVKASVIRDIERFGFARRSDIHAIIPSRTLERRLSADGNLRLDEADALARLVRVVRHARDTFEKDDIADEWLRSGNPSLGNRIPIEMARTDIGAREVDAVLTRIEHGVYS